MPDEEDWGKLKQVVKYLNGTKHLKLTLTVESLRLLKWYVDGSHNVHWDCKGHGGAMFTMGKGSMSNYSRKIKLNTKISTETELLAADMYMPKMLWSLNFIQAQGYEAECMGLYQDNISSQLLVKNGRMSSRKKTKHIKSNFFFIKDRVDIREIKVIDCRTEEMQAEVLIKTLKGMAFRTMQAELMNCPVNYDKDDECKSNWAKQKSTAAKMGKKIATKQVASMSPQECVGHKQFRTVATDRSVRDAVAKRMWQVGVGWQKRGRE